MSAGYQPTTTDVNNTLGRMHVALRQAFADLVTFKVWLDAQSDTVLKTAPFTFVQADVDLMRSALADDIQLNNIRLGTANLTVAKDFTAFAKQLTGII